MWPDSHAHTELEDYRLLYLRDGLIVTGDGVTAPYRGTLIIDRDRIAAVERRDYSGGVSDKSVQLHGRLVMPGAIDPHAHAVAPGPRFASGTPGVSLSESLGNLRRHLAQGHTTVVDLDGFKVPDETAQVRDIQPVRVESATVHFDPMFEAADAVDGTGLSSVHREMTAQAMAQHGACVIGEVGAGMTLGGGGQDYMYIPAAIELETGVRVKSAQAAQLKYAVLGRRIAPGHPDMSRVASLLLEYGLSAHLSPERACRLIEESVMPSLAAALKGVVESANVAKAIGIPTLVHNSAPSDEATREASRIAGPLLIAGHSNHKTFDVAEAIATAEYVRSNGSVVEVDTFDSWGERDLDPRPTTLLALVDKGLVDIFATDYAAGSWDGMFEAVEDVWRNGAATLEQAVAMATGNVAKALPSLRQSRGFLRSGLYADVVCADPRHPSLIEAVYLGGSLVLTPRNEGPWVQ